LDNANIPFATRITWAVEISQGVAYLHARSVVWADGHFRNILLTDDFHVVLCDFNFSILNPEKNQEIFSAPPAVFNCPPSYIGNIFLFDIFVFGVGLFTLLETKFPFCEDLHPTADTMAAVFTKHCEGRFASISDTSVEQFFGSVLNKCFKMGFSSAAELVAELFKAYLSYSVSGVLHLIDPDPQTRSSAKYQVRTVNCQLLSNGTAGHPL
jgi:protein kinase X